MASQELLELKKVLEQEKEALMKGAVEEILKWASYKARIVDTLKERELTQEDKELLKEIVAINERNKKIIEAGLSFIEEAYNFLNKYLSPSNGYGKNKAKSAPRLLSRSA